MQVSCVHQLFSVAGAVLILVAYIGHQMKWIAVRSVLYNVLNMAGSIILGYVAWHPLQVGFVVLESVWAVVSLYALLQVYRSFAKPDSEAPSARHD